MTGHASGRESILEPAFEAETDRLTRTKVSEGNSVTFMPSGAQSYAKHWQLIEDAERTVHLVTFSARRRIRSDRSSVSTAG